MEAHHSDGGKSENKATFSGQGGGDAGTNGHPSGNGHTASQQQQQTLERSQHLLEETLLALDRHIAVITSRIAEVQQSIAQSNNTMNEQKRQQEEAIARLNALFEKQKSVTVELEATQAELQAVTASLAAQRAERTQLLTGKSEVEARRTQISKKSVEEASSKSRTEIKLNEIQRQIDQLDKELGTANSDPAHKETHGNTKKLERQKEQLIQQRDKLTHELQTSSNDVQHISEQLLSTIEEEKRTQDLILQLDDAIKKKETSMEVLRNKEQVSQLELRQLDDEDSNLKLQISKFQKALYLIENNAAGLQKLLGALEKELENLNDHKKQYSEQLESIHNGDIAVAEQVMTASQRIEAPQSHPARSDSPTQKLPLTESKVAHLPIEVAPMQDISPPVKAVRMTVLFIGEDSKHTKKQGVLTVTSCVVMFEASDDSSNKYKLCVDMEDVASCRLIPVGRAEDQANKGRTEPALLSKTDLAAIREAMEDEREAQRQHQNSHPPTPNSSHSSQSTKSRISHTEFKQLEAEELVFEIVLRNDFKNRFLFDEDTGTVASSTVFHHIVRFSGEPDSLRALYTTLHQAILYHEGLLVAVPEKPTGKTSAATTPSTGASTNPNSPQSSSQKRVLELHITGESGLLSKEAMHQLLAAVPRRYQLLEWKMKYSMSQHGTSIRTLFQRIANSDVTILIIRDSKGKTFGGYASQKWHDKKDFYGTGECFVFEEKGNAVVTYAWNGSNNYFMWSDEKSIAMGGGGHFAFYLDEHLERGSSGACSTFESPCLASGEEFICHFLEAWAPLTED